MIGEHHPCYLGVYEGAMGREDVREYVESSDCVILLGFFMTDINLGVFTARLDQARCIRATSEKMSVRFHTMKTSGSKISSALCSVCRGARGDRSRGFPGPPLNRPSRGAPGTSP